MSLKRDTDRVECGVESPMLEVSSLGASTGEFGINEEDGMKGKDKTKEQLMWELAEMRRRVAKLEASEAEYKRMELSQLQDVQRLFVQGPAVVFRWRAEEGWPIEYVSPNAEGQFGYRPDDSTSGRILYRDIIHPDDILHLFEELRECAKSGKEYLRQEYRIRSMDGIYRWVSDYTLLIKDDSGITTHYLGYITDITEHKRMGAELSASEEYYCTVFENTGTATVIIEEDAIISLVNEEFVSLSGYSKEELEGKKSWTEFVAKEDLVRMMQYQKSRGDECWLCSKTL